MTRGNLLLGLLALGLIGIVGATAAVVRPVADRDDAPPSTAEASSLDDAPAAPTLGPEPLATPPDGASTGASAEPDDDTDATPEDASGDGEDETTERHAKRNREPTKKDVAREGDDADRDEPEDDGGERHDRD